MKDVLEKLEEIKNPKVVQEEGKFLFLTNFI
jgi:hypothetical protein